MTENRPRTRPDQRTLILHIGQPNTGSTSIQHALVGYDDGSTAWATFDHPNHSHYICTAFDGNFLSHPVHGWVGCDEKEIREQRELYRAEFSAMLERRDRSRIVVSAEDAWWMSANGKMELVEFIRQRGWEVYVVAYVREPLGWATSWIMEEIRSNRISEIPSKVDPGYKAGLLAFSALLPADYMQVSRYDRSTLAGENVVEDFCQTLGLKLPNDLSSENESLSLPALKLLFRFNRSGLLTEGDFHIHNTRNRFVRMLAKTYEGGKRLDSSLLEGIVDRSETDWLYETFAVDFRQPEGTHHEDSEAQARTALEACLMDLFEVDLSCLDELLAGYGIRHENFTTAEEKLHRLFYVRFVESALRSRTEILFHSPGKTLVKYLLYCVLKLLSRSPLLSRARRGQLAQMATQLRYRWTCAAL